MNTSKSSTTLNIDVLLVIVAFCEGPTLSTLIRTCKAFYHTAARHYLEDRGATLRSDREIALFLRFMRPDQGKRWRYLYELHFDKDSLIGPSLAKSFAYGIKKAVNLEVLKFAYVEATLSSHPDLGPAFASLPRIKHITMSKVGGIACKMLETMQWPLETAALCRTALNRKAWPDENRYERLNPAQLFKNACRTLRSLNLDSWRDYVDHSPLPVYPRMKSLTVIGNNCPSTAPWAAAYPHLGYLEVSTIEQALLDLSEDSLELYLETREENRQGHLTRGTWKELETFKGAPLDLYLVGVPCRIRRLELDIMKDELRFLPIVVADTLPAELILDLASQVLNGGDNAWLLDHLRDPALSSVRALTLTLRDHLPSTADFPDFWDRLADALPSLTLDSLAVKIKIESMKDMHWFTFSSPTGSDSDSARRAEQARIDRPMPPPCETELYISTLAADTLARRFLQVSHSLESVEVDVAFWWNSEYENKNVRMTRRELHPSAGLTGASDLSAVTA
ncbi:uncharacterized protein TRAVEDRAFT_32017 [Trametes versicolor FP-101664 SS1]|uniref:uncharacterized protein n=1 Tax=Trametes versicolor (strain FP-101664) TaxID=717944 RepID=UPI0004624551|nr:uncharacterized protein TRAVEDRAFT_32017 [Trametes versicolor FP-101664 SS1]EIW52140.1 hypothetical protein TRAVEDRAFT_32017 [Trametes versicolor FP-101664 SS1]